jgi:7-cyano-7-deazaguanine synthase in queuosine biosynthesis
MAPIRIFCDGQKPLTIASEEGADGQYRFSVASGFIPEFSLPAARDLLRVGQASFLTDRAYRRGTRLGQRTRDLRVVVPVEEPKRWKGLADSLNGFVGFVSHDRWQFDFERLPTIKTKRVDRRLPENACVSLFSGGLDSLCGAAAALNRGDSPIFVTHSPPGSERVAETIQRLSQEVGANSPEARYVGFRFQASDRTNGGTRSLFPERSRRTRPALFLSLAGAVALECGVRRIYLNENGVLAINLPFQPHLTGSLATRHAHPQTLRRFESLLCALWEGQDAPEVKNPFAAMTKGEQITILGSARDLALETISCEYAGQQIAMLIAWLRDQGKPYLNVRECGLCYPCLVRRAAMKFAEVPEKNSHYAFDVRRCFGRSVPYRTYPLYEFLERNAKDLLAFCETIKEMNPSDYVVRYAAQLAICGESDPLSHREVFQLYQRFAEQTGAMLMGK